MARLRFHASPLLYICLSCEIVLPFCSAAKHFRQPSQLHANEVQASFGGARLPLKAREPLMEQRLTEDVAAEQFSPAAYLLQSDPTGMAETTPAQKDLFMRYSESLNLVVCSCAKCGSTSMYKYIYAKIFGQEWPYRDSPWMQDVWTERWNHLFALYDDPGEQREIMRNNGTFSFALIRDPKERIISAWKSKASCESEQFDSDEGESRYNLLNNMFALQGWGEHIYCLNLDDFVESLYNIHKLGRKQYPQHLGCFNRFPPEQWSMITTVTNTSSFIHLSENLGARFEDIPINHFSTDTVEVTPKVADMLDFITADEYAQLRNYLPEPSKATKGSLVIAIHHPVHA